MCVFVYVLMESFNLKPSKHLSLYTWVTLFVVKTNVLLQKSFEDILIISFRWTRNTLKKTAVRGHKRLFSVSKQTHLQRWSSLCR